MYASEYIWNGIKYMTKLSVIAEDKEQGLVSIAEPVGVICGVTQQLTNQQPFSKHLLLLRHVTLSFFAFHPSVSEIICRGSSSFVMQLLKQVHPKDCIQWIEVSHLSKATGLWMNHP